jgi:putative MATE family efflux protein
MRSPMTQEERYIKMTETPISRLIPSLAIPTIISMLVTSIYNMADTFFVSRISTSASAAVGVSYSLMAMIQALGFTLGMGSGNYLSRVLGSRDEEKAERIASTGFYTAIFVGLVFAAICLPNLDLLVRLLGATDTIAPYAKDYAKYILMAAPVMTGALSMNNLLRFQGLAVYSMIGITTGGILNMILDPIFIFGLNLGISGAALATALSQCISFGILFFQSLLRKDCVHLKPGKITLSLSLYGEIFHGGIPSLCRQGVASIATAALNVAANPFGDAAIAALSIVSRYMMFIGSAMIGFGQGFQPVCGFNFGAKRYDRVLEAFWFCVKVAVVFLVTLSVVSFVGAPQIMRIFRKEDLDVIEIGTWALRFQCVTLPLSAWIVMSNMMTQTIGYGFRASLVAAGRQGLFLIPALFVLPVKFGIRGLQLCQPVADALTFVLGVVIVLGILRELKEKQEQVE